MDFTGLKMKFGASTEEQSPLSEPARVMIYGKAKTRKTWWAGTAGATHNVTILDGDNGTGILQQLPTAYLDNINRVPLATDTDAVSMGLFLTLLFQKKTFIFSIEKQRDIGMQHIKGGAGEEDEHKLFLACDLTKLTTDDVLVIDNYSSIVKSVTRQFIIEQGIDPYDGKLMEKGDNKYAYFNYSNLVLDNILEGLNKLPCHVILIAHEDRYVHEYKEGMVTKKDTRLQVLSSSGNQAAKIPGSVGDILWAKHNAALDKTILSSKPSNDRDGGARRLPPADYEFPSWEWKDYAEIAKLPPVKHIRSANEQPPFALLTGSMIKQLIEEAQASSSSTVNG